MLGLGSDDALLFHSLKCLNDILKKNKGEKILLWDKLFYCWPGVLDKKQENMFFVSKMYQKDKITTSHLDCNSLLNQILQFNVSMYMLPMIYINSAMHRSVIEDIVKKTGRFLDGWSQDVYTGLVNLSLYKSLLYIQYPITIAGLSEKSVGFSANYADKYEQLKDNKLLDDHYLLASKFNEYYSTKYVPRTMEDFDRTVLLIEFLKIKDKGINKWDNNMVNWKNYFALCAEHITKGDIRFNEKMDDILNTIRIHGDKALEQWFRTNYYDNGYAGSDNSSGEYQKGFFSDVNSLRINMSQFGVDNIFGVAGFFRNLYNI